MKLKCLLHGKLFHLQTHSVGIEAGEYAFYTGFPAVFREDCDKCKDINCPHGFNIRSLRNNKKIRKRLLNYVFNPIVDTFADKYQISVDTYIRCTPIIEPIKSSICVRKRDGRKLIKLEEQLDKKIEEARELREKLSNEFLMANHLPQRTLGKKKN